MSDWSFHVNNQLTRDDHPQYMRVAGLRPTDPVPIGGLAGQAIGPGIGVNYAAGTTTVLTLAVPVVNGQSYMISLAGFGQQITNASAPTQLYVTDSLSAFILRAIMTNLAINGWAGGGASQVISPTSTTTDTFTVTVSATANSFAVAANTIGLAITRVT